MGRQKEKLEKLILVIFNHEAHEGPSAAKPQPKGIGISRAKPTKIAKLKDRLLGGSGCGAFALGVLGARNLVFSTVTAASKLARAAKILKHSSTKDLAIDILESLTSCSP